MKKYKVIKRYVDKYDKEIHYTGETVALEATRAAELKGYVKEVKEKNKDGK